MSQRELVGEDPMTSPELSSPAIELSNDVPSRVTYKFQVQKDYRGWRQPIELGMGNFAAVYQGQQYVGGRPSRSVAIKILHNHATYVHEALFTQEIHHLRKLSDAGGVNIVGILDVLQIGPMVLCGCGRIYEPRCPECGQRLVRKDDTDQKCPALHCVACTYNLPGDRVGDRKKELFRARAKTCCQAREFADSGTLLNFVHRDAIVMEQVDTSLRDFAARRQQSMESLCQLKSVSTRELVRASASPPPGLWERFTESLRAPGDMVVAAKVLLLEKVLLMVQLAESVAWLHADRQVIHKDLAPDNVMVRLAGSSDRAPWLGDDYPGLAFRDVLNDMASYPTFKAVLIDFGLADETNPTRSWYDDDAARGHLKEPFLSPEAMSDRKQYLNLPHRIEFEPELRRFAIPPDMQRLQTPLMPGDTIVDQLDREHRNDLKIERIEEGYAYYAGTPPLDRDLRQVWIERPLLEPHDIYALGMLFYFILTNDLHRVRALRGLIDSLQVKPVPLVLYHVQVRDLYPSFRDAIQSPHWRDEMMLLVLRATTRGLPGSFAQSRIQRGPDASRSFLRAIKKLYQAMQRDILSTPARDRLAFLVRAKRP